MFVIFSLRAENLAMKGIDPKWLKITKVGSIDRFLAEARKIKMSNQSKEIDLKWVQLINFS